MCNIWYVGTSFFGVPWGKKGSDECYCYHLVSLGKLCSGRTFPSTRKLTDHHRQLVSNSNLSVKILSNNFLSLTAMCQSPMYEVAILMSEKASYKCNVI